ncbi:FMN-binding negative transcriptional regulator [Variovorax sp. LARHSF232]
MYLPPQFNEKDRAVAIELMRANAFASLITTDDEGHCTVQARLVETPHEKDALLKRLIGEHEPAYAQQWRDLGEEFQHKLLAGLVGFELRVTELQCKIKLNQHRPESHAAMHAIYAAGSPDEQALAGWMQRLGMAPSSNEA